MRAEVVLHSAILFSIKLPCLHSAAPKHLQCLKINRIAWRRLPPYTDIVNNTYNGITEHIFQLAMKECCIGNLKYDRSLEFYTQDKVTNITTNDNNIDFIYPVQRDSKSRRYLIYPFIPLVESPGFALFVKPVKVGVATIKRAMTSVIPLLVCMLILVAIAGTLYWMLENMTLAWYGETPERFLPGVMNGIWWAVVTMTTVGYGDVVPQTKPGRIFSVIWVFIGITFAGIFTSSITMVFLLSLYSHKGKLDLSHQGVAVLRASEEYRYVFTKRGIPVEFDSVDEIAAALNNHTVTIALIDVIVAGNHQEQLTEFILNEVIETMSSSGVILLNNGGRYEQCVRQFIFNSQRRIVDHVSENVKVVRYEKNASATSGLIDPSQPMFQKGVLIMSFTLIFFILLGVVKPWVVKKFMLKESRRKSFCPDEENELVNLRNSYRREFFRDFAIIRESCEHFINNSETVGQCVKRDE